MSTKLFIQIADDDTIERIVVETKDSLGAIGTYNHVTADGKPAPAPPQIVACVAWAKARAGDVADAKLRAALKAAGVSDEHVGAAITAAKSARSPR
jgi:hypothetical protein